MINIISRVNTNKEDIDAIRRIVQNVEGYLSDAEGAFLYSTAKSLQGNGVIVEIGSWKGKSTIWLTKGSKEGKQKKVYAIDPHQGSPEHQEIYGKVATFEQFSNNIHQANVQDLIVPMVMTSEAAVKELSESIEFLFIDGNHEYEMVKKDFEMWFPKVADGGIIALHDSIGGWIGPKKVAKEYIFSSRYFSNVGFIGSITFGRKVRKNTLKDMLWNKLIMIMISAFEWSDKIKLKRLTLLKKAAKKILRRNPYLK